MNDKCPIKYTVHRQSSVDGDAEVGLGDNILLNTALREACSDSDDQVVTHVVRHDRSSQSDDDTDSEDVSDSEETEGVDESPDDYSSDSEHELRNNRSHS